MSSTSSSSLARYRPIILSVIGLTVCCSVYYAVAYNPKPPAPLHRSNAVHRRRHRPRSTTPENAVVNAPDNEAIPTGPANASEQGHMLQSGDNQGDDNQDDDNQGDDNQGGDEQNDAEQNDGEQNNGVPDDGDQDGSETVATVAEIEIQPGGNLKELLYYIAEDQSRQNAYVHRGVICNSCYIKPIRGVRWRCANCADYDLCAECEASSMHDKTHIFYKVKVPAPFLGSSRQEAVIYPGTPGRMPRSLSKGLWKKFMEEMRFDKEEIEALYDQFTCLANTAWAEDPNGIGYAINRAAFDTAFIPLTSINPPQPNLLYDRIFSFYDSNDDSLIGFEEFLRGLAHVQNKIKDGNNKRKLIFDGFDMDRDGHISRQDILRIFRAYYTIQKDLTHDLVAVQEEDFEIGHVESLLFSPQPLSAIFTEPPYPPYQTTDFSLDQKSPNEFGEQRHGGTPLLDSTKDVGPRDEIVANMSGEGQPTRGRALSFSSETSDMPEVITQDRTEPIDPKASLRERYQRRQYYIDGEEGCEISDPDEAQPSSSTANPDITPLGLQRSAPIWNIGKTPENGTDATPFPPHTASRTRVINHNNRRVSVPDQEIGKEILYQVVQEGLNELLDPIFKEKEDLHLEVQSTKTARAKWRKQITEFKRKKQKKHQSKAESAIADDTVDPLDSRVNGSATQSKKVQGMDESLSPNERTPEVASAGGAPDRSCMEKRDGSNDADDSMKENSKEFETEIKLVRDPTMPQFLPNSQADIDCLGKNAELVSPIDSSKDQITSETHGSPNPAVDDENGSATARIGEIEAALTNDLSPSLEQLERYTLLDDTEQEILRAGGPGRISFAEFEDSINGEGGRKLAFVDSWFELGSF